MQSEQVNLEAKKCQKDMIVSDELWNMCKNAAFKRLRKIKMYVMVTIFEYF